MIFCRVCYCADIWLLWTAVVSDILLWAPFTSVIKLIFSFKFKCTYFHSLITIYIPSRSLRSASEHRLVVPSQRGTKSLSRTFSFTVPGRWNDPPPPPPSGMLNPWQFSSGTWKLISYVITWLYLKKNKTTFTLFPYHCSLSLNLSLSG